MPAPTATAILDRLTSLGFTVDTRPVTDTLTDHTLTGPDRAWGTLTTSTRTGRVVRLVLIHGGVDRRQYADTVHEGATRAAAAIEAYAATLTPATVATSGRAIWPGQPGDTETAGYIAVEVANAHAYVAAQRRARIDAEVEAFCADLAATINAA